jgi:hypothetical protein
MLRRELASKDTRAIVRSQEVQFPNSVGAQLVECNTPQPFKTGE